MCLVFLFLVGGRLEAAQSSAPWITKDEQEQMIQRLHTVLPGGWTITRTTLNSSPDDWYSLDKRGFENVGDHDLNILGPPGGDVMVDGTRYQHKDSVIMDGNFTLRVNDVAAHAIDLSGLIADGGLHRVEYQLGTASSNQLSLQVQQGDR